MVRCRFIAVRSLNHYLFEKALSCLRGAIGSVYRSSNVAGAAGGTRSIHPRYRRGKGILHPTFRSPSSSQKPVPVYTVIGCHMSGPRLSAHRFRTRILFRLLISVSARTPLLPLCFPSCPTRCTSSCSIPPLFPASISVLVPAPILFPSRSCTCYSTNPRPYSILSRGPLPAPLPSVTIRRRVGNRRDEAMAAAQGRGHVV